MPRFDPGPYPEGKACQRSKLPALRPPGGRPIRASHSPIRPYRFIPAGRPILPLDSRAIRHLDGRPILLPSIRAPGRSPARIRLPKRRRNVIRRCRTNRANRRRSSTIPPALTPIRSIRGFSER
jgi:hypothetical protein